MRIIDFNSTKCRHCYKCVRNCEIKAISVLGGRAEIMEDRCILCGRCLAVCPQEAKTMTSELAAVKAMIRRGEKVAAQLAPAYLGLLAFREIGYLKLIEEGKMDNIITTCCPAANDLIEMYHPALVSSLAPVVSPMIAAGRIIKKKLGGDTRVVFVGPCIAKRKEAEDPRHADAVDAVISFHELNGWLQDENIRIAECESDPFPFDPAVNRIYPVTGGVLSSMSASLGEKAKNGYRQVCVHGLRNCIEFCRDMEAGSMHHCVVEMNVCEHGCIKGPAITDKEAYPFKIRLDMEERVLPEPAAAEALRRSTDGVSLRKEFRDRSIHELRPSEEEIRAVLAKTGKHSPADELNCGACGYASCREKAAAVLQGKAELEMCIPYLTAQAESMANLILKESPNAVIIVDGAQRILEYSDIGERFFGVSREQALNSFLWELIDPKDCETVYRTHQNVYGDHGKAHAAGARAPGRRHRDGPERHPRADVYGPENRRSPRRDDGGNQDDAYQADECHADGRRPGRRRRKGGGRRGAPPGGRGFPFTGRSGGSAVCPAPRGKAEAEDQHEICQTCAPRAG